MLGAEVTRILLNRALTVRQPWAWAIVTGWKDVENRVWNTSYRDTLHIHSGLAQVNEEDLGSPLIRNAIDTTRQAGFPLDFKSGYILGSVELAGVHHANDCRNPQGQLCSPWALPGNYHWALTEPNRLTCPFPEKGKQGLWKF